MEIMTESGVCSESALEYLCIRMSLGESYFLFGDINAPSSVGEDLEWVYRNFNATMVQTILQYY